MNFGRKALACSTIVSAVVLLVPASAMGATYTAKHYAGVSLLSTATFKQGGEIYTIKDDRADGKAAILYKSDRLSSGYFAVSGGAGSTRTINANLPEGSQVRFAACYGEKNNPANASCGAVKTVTA